MISRMVRGSRGDRAALRVSEPQAIILALVLAGVAAFGWLASPFGLAVAVGLQLIVGGLGAVWLLGPVRVGLGFARYATLAAAGVGATLFGRILYEQTGLLLSPVAALLLWGVMATELDVGERRRAGLALDLMLVGIVFTGAAGVQHLVAADAWPPGLILLAIIVSIPILRAAEARGASGVEAVGQAALHVLGVAQAAAALALLRPPGVLGAALVALAYHAWGSAASALEDGEPGWRVGIEVGALALMGVVLAILVATR
jgi:hypothetical protein